VTALGLAIARALRNGARPLDHRRERDQAAEHARAGSSCMLSPAHNRSPPRQTLPGDAGEAAFSFVYKLHPKIPLEVACH
jgi:hypothetical protein